MNTVTVIITLYNKEKYIGRAINSVISQSIKPNEIIIVDDGSTDNSLNIVKSFNSEIPLIIINEENKGPAAARNRGIKAAKYDYIAFLDGDDYWGQNHIEILLELLNNYPKYNFFATSYKYLKGSGNFVDIKHHHSFKGNIIDNFFRVNLKDPVVTSSNVLISKIVFKTIGYFNEFLVRSEDRDMWIRISLQHHLIYSPVKTVIIDRTAEGRISRNRNIVAAEDLIFKYKKKLQHLDYACEYFNKFAINRAIEYINTVDFKSAGLLLNASKDTKLFKGKWLIVKIYGLVLNAFK